jgi:hypothetical protein
VPLSAHSHARVAEVGGAGDFRENSISDAPGWHTESKKRRERRGEELR